MHLRDGGLGCEYTGEFSRLQPAGRRAGENVSGTFQCNTLPFRRGTFEGTLSRLTRYSLLLVLNATDNTGIQYSTTHALMANVYSFSNAAPLSGEAASTL
jgi:hypothetical protein